MMKNKKLIASTLATLCLSASLAVPAFAAEPENVATTLNSPISITTDEDYESPIEGEENEIVSDDVITENENNALTQEERAALRQQRLDAKNTKLETAQATRTKRIALRDEKIAAAREKQATRIAARDEKIAAAREKQSTRLASRDE